MKLIATLALGVTLAVPLHAEDFTARSGGPSCEAMLARSVSGTPEGLTFFRPVLSGVLYFAGFKGGDKEREGLSGAQRETQCADGFSRAFYADFGKNTQYGATACTRGSLDDQSARSSRPAEVMKAVFDVVKSPGEGPVLVHCMWGVHASGARPAMALVRFCDWSEDRAKAYWDAARNGAPCSQGCDTWIDRKFEHCSKNPDLTLTQAEMAAICPQ